MKKDFMKNYVKKNSQKRKLFILLGVFLTYTLLCNVNILASTSDQLTGSQEQVISDQNAQSHEVKGKITDSNTGEPLPGVNITVQNTTIGTVTDLNGNYVLQVDDPNTTLVFSYVGYLTETIPLQGQSSIDITMVMDILAMDEIVVIGYGTMKKDDLTGTISTVKAEDINNVPVLGIDQALQGKTAGVHITQNSGSPGASVMVRIRGIGTINNSNPLYVVDGMPIDYQDINMFNPADIESISILKDASAAAIYGSQAANGVIMITTKKGVAGKMQVNVNSYYGMQQVPGWQNMMNGPEYARTYNILRDASPGDATYLDPDTVISTDWFDEISRKAPIQNINFSISGGNETSTYAISSSLFDQQGVIKGTDFARQTVRINSDHKVKKWLSAGENLSVSFSKMHRTIEQRAYGSPVIETIIRTPVSRVYQADGNWQVDNYAPGDNPVAIIELENREEKNTKIMGTAYLEVEPIKGLKFKSVGGLDLNFSEDDDFDARFNYGPAQQLLNSRLVKEFGKSFSWLWENTVTYSRTFDIHNITLMAGTSANSTMYYNLKGTHSMGPENEDETLRYFNIFGSTGIIEGEGVESSIASLLGRLNYVLADKYLFTASIRRDGSSRFGPGYKWGVFPSFAGAWKISNENFMSDIPVINSLKLRVGWGKIGNEKIGDYLYTSTVDRNLNYSFDGTLAEGFTALRPENKEVRWETTIQTNIGIDAGLLENRILFTGDYFVRTTTEMLNEIDLPGVTGIPDTRNPIQNIGEVQNKGFEFSLTWRKMEGSFNYSLGGNIAIIHNEVINLGEEGQFISAGSFGQGFEPLTRTEAGHPIGAFYGYKTDGIFQNIYEVNAHAFQNRNTAPGDFRFVDVNGDGVINAFGDQIFIGSPHPDFTYGLNLDLFYKGLDLVMFFQGVYGNEILKPYMNWINDPSGSGRNLSRDMLDAWTEDNHSNENPRLDTRSDNSNLRYSDFYIEDGSYLRLKNIQLGYSLPANVTELMAISKFRVYVGGQNLLTFTKYSGADPEVGMPREVGADEDQLIFGVDFGIVPQPRTVLVGVELSF